MKQPFDLHDYEDILHLPHHVSSVHKPMSRVDRAAQFSPFAALTGYDDDVSEAARLTDTRISLSEEAMEELDRKQLYLAELVDSRPEIRVTYFVPDGRKEGGAYRTLQGRLTRIDPYERILRLDTGAVIPLDRVTALQSEVFGETFE